jgi:stringent starvation protein B
MTTSTKPYLIRAIYEWCLDQGYTPHVAALVDENTSVPPGYARDGQIVLNLGRDATHQLMMGNERITFQARFAGVAHVLSIPVANVVAVYARENGHGMAFELEGEEGMEAGLDAETEVQRASPASPGEPDGPRPDPQPPRGHLKVVK